MQSIERRQDGGVVVAIHQPNFFPWLGYFEKIARSNVFIFLDQVQFPKTGGTWCNRVKLLLSGQAHWMTAPVDRSFDGVKAIHEITFLNHVPWREKMLKSLSLNYAKAACYEEAMDFLRPLILNPENRVAQYNIDTVSAIADALGIGPGKFRYASRMQSKGNATELLVELTKEAGGQIYMCGGGASGYQEDKLFEISGLDLLYQNFEHPVYPQFSGQSFVAGLSIIDALMHLGLAGVRVLLMTNKG